MLYLLDTNIISELTKSDPNRAVTIRVQSFGTDARISSVTIEEMRYGVRMLAEGKRKRALEDIVDTLLRYYDDCVLAYGAREAELCARFHHEAHSRGMNVGIEDLMIAATSVTAQVVLVTRNTKDFEFLGIRLLNPFA